MNKKSCLWIGLLLVLIVACIAGIVLVYFQTRPPAVISRPLILIHNPINHAVFQAGDGVLVHATIRADSGLARAELWADEILVASRAVTDGTAPTSLILSEDWIASVVGKHMLIVRAFAADGGEGQASIVVEVEKSKDTSADTHVVQEGETVESIASDYGMTPEELAASNPDIGSGGPTPGDELVLPDDEPPATGSADAPAADEGDAPVPESVAPADSGFDFGFFNPFGRSNAQSGSSTGLRVEFLSMMTGAPYEGLHCYIGTGDASPRWYPDRDNDQTSDESFVLQPAEGASGGIWSLEADMSGGGAPTIFWPDNTDLPISVSCVGITGGGTEALELGLWEESISSENWTGRMLTGGADGVDGSFDLVFRITRLGGRNSGIPLWLDRNMTPPTNARIVRVVDRPTFLTWDYEPPADEEAVSGFRVYLNGTLQWVESATARESRLPPEWTNAPCGSTYTFTVTAYRNGLPDGPESLPAIVIIQPTAQDCQREEQISFLTLETFDLGGDGRFEDRHGDVGPPYGTFYANEQQITFDGGDLGSGGLDKPNGFSHNTTYDLGDLAADPDWHFSGMPALVVDVPEGGTFEFGYRIMDEDSGDCDDSSDPGCDDLICEGLSMIYEDNALGELGQNHEGSLISDDGRCRVTYTFGPAFDSPVGSGAPGSEALPWISVEDIVIDEAAGQVQIDVRNTGSATWAGRDLIVDLKNRSGTSFGLFTWPGFVLEPGQRTVLENPDMRLSSPFDACVVIDPFDDVLEEFESSGAMVHTSVCEQQPDLTITNVDYIPSEGLLLTIQNVGEGALENRAISFRTYQPDGTPLYADGWWPNITLGRYETKTFSLGNSARESIRQQMQTGYQVVVNPDGAILESDATNNTFSVAPYQLRVSWCDARIPHYNGAGSSARMFLTTDILNGSASRPVFESSRTSTLTSTETLFAQHLNIFHYWAQGHSSDLFSCIETSEPFAILGDESLRVSIQADFQAGSRGDREDLGTATEVFGADRYSGFPVVTTSMTDTHCQRYEVAPNNGDLYPRPWFAYVCIGRITP